MDQFSNIMTSHMSDLFDDDSINKINTLTPIKPIVQDDDIFGENRVNKLSEINSEKQNIDIVQIKESLLALKTQIDNILGLLEGSQNLSPSPIKPISKTLIFDTLTIAETSDTGDKFLEGVFNGEKMLGSDGKEYTVPPNYASKSKLVEGDIMKLTFAPNGRFFYKKKTHPPTTTNKN